MAKETGLATLSHVLAIFTWFVGPLVIYLATEDEFAKENAANALNWQIVFTIGLFISGILTIILIGPIIGALLGVLNIVFCAIAALKAYEGETWEYPATPKTV